MPDYEEQEENNMDENKEITKENMDENEEITNEHAFDENEEGTEEYTDENEDKLPFAKAEVVRLMKEHLDDDKMIRERVKVEMNKFLGDVLKNVCKQLNDYPYTTVEYEMLRESTYPYTNIERINQEKERILLHLEAIKADCNALAMDVKKTLKLKDVHDEEEFTSHLIANDNKE